MKKINIINATDTDLDELYADNSLTFTAMKLDKPDDFLPIVEWMNENGCDMKSGDVYYFTGELMNKHYSLTEENVYPNDMHFVAVKLSNLTNVLAIAVPSKFIYGRWFNDIVDNNRRREFIRRRKQECAKCKRDPKFCGFYEEYAIPDEVSDEYDECVYFQE